jgi:cytochrome b561
MSLRNTTSTYGSVAKFLHWLIALLVIGMLIIGAMFDYFESIGIKGQVMAIHKATGVTILGLMLLRLLWALTNPKPRLPEHINALQGFLARSVHVLFYILLIGLPINGILLSSFAGRPINFYGLFEFILPVTSNKALAKQLSEIHEILAWTVLGLLVAHVFAALLHHFYYKDNVLRRMLPGQD